MLHSTPNFETYCVTRYNLFKPASMLFDRICLDASSAINTGLPANIAIEWPNTAAIFDSAAYDAGTEWARRAWRNEITQSKEGTNLVIASFLRSVAQAYCANGGSVVPLGCPGGTAAGQATWQGWRGESVMLAPKSEVSLFPWKDSKDKIPVAVRQVRSFLRAHRPAMA
jgi:hypothetical protein